MSDGSLSCLIAKQGLCVRHAQQPRPSSHETHRGCNSSPSFRCLVRRAEHARTASRERAAFGTPNTTRTHSIENTNDGSIAAVPAGAGSNTPPSRTQASTHSHAQLLDVRHAEHRGRGGDMRCCRVASVRAIPSSPGRDGTVAGERRGNDGANQCAESLMDEDTPRLRWTTEPDSSST